MAGRKKVAPTKKPAAKIGRPSVFTQDIADRICEAIAEGTPVARILDAPGMPGRTTMYRWLQENEAFRNKHARAREDSADADADEIASVARKVLEGKIDPQAARVGIDALKWAASMRKPKVYGSRLDVTSTSTVYVKPDASMTPEQAAEAYRTLLKPA